MSLRYDGGLGVLPVYGLAGGQGDLTRGPGAGEDIARSGNVLSQRDIRSV